MDLQSIIENYGYAAILIGTFLEEETLPGAGRPGSPPGLSGADLGDFSCFSGQSLRRSAFFLFGTQTQSGGIVQAADLEAESGKSSPDDESI